MLICGSIGSINTEQIPVASVMHETPVDTPSADPLGSSLNIVQTTPATGVTVFPVMLFALHANPCISPLNGRITATSSCVPLTAPRPQFLSLPTLDVPQVRLIPTLSLPSITEPGSPVAPVAPCGPVAPVSPVAPVGPAGPAGPVAPSIPSTPSVPGSPGGPAGPCGPVAPSAPGNP